jgi:hypothetical protein
MKHSWEHWSAMGFDLGETVDEDGNKDIMVSSYMLIENNYNLLKM